MPSSQTLFMLLMIGASVVPQGMTMTPHRNFDQEYLRRISRDTKKPETVWDMIERFPQPEDIEEVCSELPMDDCVGKFTRCYDSHGADKELCDNVAKEFAIAHEKSQGTSASGVPYVGLWMWCLSFYIIKSYSAYA